MQRESCFFCACICINEKLPSNLKSKPVGKTIAICNCLKDLSLYVGHGREIASKLRIWCGVQSNGEEAPVVMNKINSELQ